jgi:ribosomal protein S18 acetylase RimI-like enzyme
MPPFTLTPCTPSDLEGIVAVYLHAFTSTHINKIIFPPATCTEEDQASWLRARFGRLFSGMKPEIRLFKITDQETGKLAAWSRWGYPISSLADEEREKEKEKDRMENDNEETSPLQGEEGSGNASLVIGSLSKWPVGANEEACESYFGTLDQMRESYVRWEEDYVLYFLATDPVYQGRGLGTMLLNQGIELAEAESKRIYLEATEMGHPLYEKLGWRDIDLVSIDFTKWAEERLGINYVMRREPRADA